jgi:hypothetical protein
LVPPDPAGAVQLLEMLGQLLPLDSGGCGKLPHGYGVGSRQEESESGGPDQGLGIARWLEDLRRHAAQQLSFDTSRLKV